MSPGKIGQQPATDLISPPLADSDSIVLALSPLKKDHGGNSSRTEESTSTEPDAAQQVRFVVFNERQRIHVRKTFSWAFM